MTSEQIWSHEVTSHPEDVQDRSKSSTPDYRIYLPDTIKKLGLDEGVHAVVKRRDPNGIPYLEGKKLTEEDDETTDSNSVYEIFIDGSNRLRVTLSSDWIDEFLEYDGDDIFMVEVNEFEDEFRIYRNDDYHHRLDEFDDDDFSPRFGQPVVLTAAMFYKTRYSETTSIREAFVNDEGRNDSENLSEINSDEWNGYSVENNDSGYPPTPP